MNALREWVFFTDRDLGAYILPNHLRAAGLHVERHGDHFVDDALDKDWLPEVAQRGWVILSSDQRMLRSPVERDAVMESGARVLILIGANAKAEELAVNFVNTRRQVDAFLSEHDPPYFAKVYRPSPGPVTRDGPPGRVEMKLTYEVWLRKFASGRSSLPGT